MTSPSAAAGLALRRSLAAALLAAAWPAAASDASMVFSHGPDQREWLTLRTLEVRVDGVPIPVGLPDAKSDPTQATAVTRGPLSAGSHRLDVKAGFDGASDVFTYVDGVRVTMRGVLQLDVQPGDVVEVRSRVVRQDGVTVKWEDRYRLALDATIRRSGQQVAVAPVTGSQAAPDAPAVASPAPAQPAPAQPAPAPAAPMPAPAAAPARAACSLAPIRFAFAKSELTAEAAAALDQLAGCLVAGGAAVRLEGHCDAQGPEVYNQWLGAQRAAAAARHLRERGVPPERITVRSLSAGQPVCTEPGAACNARNRRVEAVVLP